MNSVLVDFLHQTLLHSPQSLWAQLGIWEQFLHLNVDVDVDIVDIFRLQGPFRHGSESVRINSKVSDSSNVFNCFQLCHVYWKLLETWLLDAGRLQSSCSRKRKGFGYRQGCQKFALQWCVGLLSFFVKLITHGGQTCLKTRGVSLPWAASHA